MNRPLHAVVSFLLIAGVAGCVQVSFDHPDARGGGEGSLALDPASVRVSSENRWKFLYTVGPSGLFEGGGFRMQLPVDPVHPVFGFTPPHAAGRHLHGHLICTAMRGEEPLALALASAGPGGQVQCLLGQEPSGGLLPGDTLELRYWGLAPRVAGNYSLAVESRLTGGRGGAPLARRPVMQVSPRDAWTLKAILPSTAVTGEEMTLAVVALDRFGNLAEGYRGEVVIVFEGQTLRQQFADEGLLLVSGLTAGREGFFRASVEEVSEDPADALRSHSNPVRILAATEPAGRMKVFWGDLHFHTGDGASGASFLSPEVETGDRRGNLSTLAASVKYARDVSRLDFACVTEYAGERRSAPTESRMLALPSDHSGAESGQGVREEGLVTFEGLEWRNQLIFPEKGIGLSAGLAGRFVIATRFPPGRDASAYEIYSSRNRGATYEDTPMSREPDQPVPIDSPFSLIGSSAGSWSQPGVNDDTGLEPDPGGLTGVFATERTRASILEGLRQGRAWATTGVRIYMHVEVSGSDLKVEIAGPAPMESVDFVIVDDGGRHEIPLIDQPEDSVIIITTLPDIPAGGMWYIRGVQVDGEMAWSALQPGENP